MGLLFALSLGMALVPIIARTFHPHLLPAWLLMAVAAGASVAAWLKWGIARFGNNGGWQVAAGAAGLLVAVLMAINSWYLNGGRGKTGGREAACSR